MAFARHSRGGTVAQFLAVLLLAPGRGALAQMVSRNACEEHRQDTFCGQPGVVWCGTDPELAAERLARHTAPILWFSPDEPLLQPPDPPAHPGERGRRSIVDLPQKLQVVDPHHCLIQDRTTCDNDPPRGAYVYWRITRLLVRNGKQAEVEAGLKRGQLVVSGIDTLTLAYFFYYERDEGLDPHYNDTEGIEVAIDFETLAGQLKRRAMVARVTGLAHGSELLSNILQVKKDLRHRTGASDVTLPITILVEEGKHASSPDRNGDGTYTPGYDVNVKVNDAWGVRDVFGSGVVSSRYRESMTKPRYPTDRVGPDRKWFDDYGSIEAPAQCYATPGGLALPKQAYTLAAAPQCPDGDPSPFCNATRALAHERPGGGEFYSDQCLGGAVKAIQAAQTGAQAATKADKCNYLNMEFSRQAFTEHDLTGFRMKYYYGPAWILQPFRYLGFAMRMEGTAVGPQLTWFSPFGFPKFGGWLAARGALLKDADEWHWRVDVSHTPSLARLADWYVAVGYDWGVSSVTDEGQSVRRDGWVTEAGIQVRFRAWWLRGGTRMSLSSGSFSRARVVAEFGYGPQPKNARVH